jgi:uncharacterized protein YndB with AHSA1/START domain
MIELRSNTRVAGMSAAFLEHFMLHCDDEKYRRWWPGTHLAFHTSDGRPGRVGSRMWMDEYIGRRRIAMAGVVEEIDPGCRLVWGLAWGVRLPVRLTLEYADEAGGVRITHILRAGFSGAGAALDPLWRLFFNPAFGRAMDDHMRTEFQRLKDVFLMENSGSPA